MLNGSVNINWMDDMGYMMALSTIFQLFGASEEMCENMMMTMQLSCMDIRSLFVSLHFCIAAFLNSSEMFSRISISESFWISVWTVQPLFSHVSAEVQTNSEKGCCVQLDSDTNLMFRPDSVSIQTNSAKFSRNSENKVHEGREPARRFLPPSVSSLFSLLSNDY